MEGPIAHTRYQPWIMSPTQFYLLIIFKSVSSNSGFIIYRLAFLSSYEKF